MALQFKSGLIALAIVSCGLDHALLGTDASETARTDFGKRCQSDPPNVQSQGTAPVVELHRPIRERLKASAERSLIKAEPSSPEPR